MARYTRLFSLAFAALLFVVTTPLTIISDVVSYAARCVTDLFQPTARESLALYRLVHHVAVIPAMRSRFRAFVENARAHVDFSAGHFDPGRIAA